MMDGCMAGWWRWQIRPGQVLMIRVVRTPPLAAAIGLVTHSTPPAAAFLAAAFTTPAAGCGAWHTRLFLCKALLNGQHPAEHPSLPQWLVLCVARALDHRGEQRTMTGK